MPKLTGVRTYMARILDDDEDFFGEEPEELIQDLKVEDIIGKPIDVTENAEAVAKDVDNVVESIAKTDITVAKSEEVVRKESVAKEQDVWNILDDTDVSDMASLIPNPARTYPFELDVFQKRAIYRISRKDHVFVAAHTSAGKTVVAEYAIAQALREGKRAIYTAPIKALSNQKYREFVQKFDSVGILTGDTKVNPEASVLVMTTEILRNLLYRGDDIVGQLGCVIFDEVHFVNDSERGVVWEETIILLPSDVVMVMLSATVPNYLEFGDWVGRTKRRNVYSVYTLFRPTPLRFFLRYEDTTHVLVDPNNPRLGVQACYSKIHAEQRAKDLEAQKAQQAKAKAKGGPAPKAKSSATMTAGAKDKKLTGDQIARTETQRLLKFLRELDAEDKLPCVVFSFSRRKCEQLPTDMSALDLLAGKAEKSRVVDFCNKALASSCLSAEDRNLPQVQFAVELMKRGLGVHHAGLLPLVKEMTELAFAEGLVKALFATETFAMGINMPAKSVVFTSVRKNQGTGFRPLYPQEFTQMAGRAGRRGIDPFGSVFIFAPIELPDQTSLQQSMGEKSDALVSKFRLTSAMILQLHRAAGASGVIGGTKYGGGGVRVEDMLARSFRENRRAQLLPKLERAIERRQQDLEELMQNDILCLFGEPDIDNYAAHAMSAELATAAVLRTVFKDLPTRDRDELFKCGRVVMCKAQPGLSPVPFPAVILTRGRVSISNNKSLLQRNKEVDPYAELSSLRVDRSDEAAARLKDPVFDVLALVPTPTKLKATDDASLSAALPLATSVSRLPPISSREDKDKHCWAVVRDMALSAMNWASALEIKDVPPALEENWAKGNTDPSAVVLGEEPGRVTTALVDAQRQDFISVALQLFDDLEEKLHDAPPPVFKLETNPKLKQHSSLLPFELVATQEKQVDALTKAAASKCARCPLRDSHFMIAEGRAQAIKDLDEWKFRLTDDSLELLPQYHARLKLLEHYGYMDNQQVLTVKGRAACLCVTSDEILLMELLMRGHLSNLPVPHLAALLSLFVFGDNKSGDDPEYIREEDGESGGKFCDLLWDVVMPLHEEIKKVAVEECKVSIDEDEMDRTVAATGMCYIVYRWARGDSLKSIMESGTEVQEGIIVRCMVRLDELCVKLEATCENLGEERLKDEIAAVHAAIRRDIVFAQSLYLENLANKQ